MCRECGCDITNEIGDTLEFLSRGKKGNPNRSKLNPEELEKAMKSIPERTIEILD